MNLVIQERRCRECKDKRCCKTGFVALTPEEYDSGFYETKRKMLWETNEIGDTELIGMTMALNQKNGVCIYLTEDNLCSIYDKRPSVCRTYTCWSL